MIGRAGAVALTCTTGCRKRGAKTAAKVSREIRAMQTATIRPESDFASTMAPAHPVNQVEIHLDHETSGRLSPRQHSEPGDAHPDNRIAVSRKNPLIATQQLVRIEATIDAMRDDVLSRLDGKLPVVDIDIDLARLERHQVGNALHFRPC